MLTQIVCLLALCCLNLLLGVIAAYLFLQRRSRKKKGTWVKVRAENSQAIDIPVHIEQSTQWLNSLLDSPNLGKAGLYVRNAEHELRLALTLCEDSRRRSLSSSDEFYRNTCMSAEFSNLNTTTVDDHDALRRFHEISTYALEQALAFQDGTDHFAFRWQQVHDEIVRLTSELQDLAAELIVSGDDFKVDETCGLIAYFESLSRNLSQQATKLKIEAKVLVAYVDVITGLLFEARSLGELVLSSANPAGDERDSA